MVIRNKDTMVRVNGLNTVRAAQKNQYIQRVIVVNFVHERDILVHTQRTVHNICTSTYMITVTLVYNKCTFIVVFLLLLPVHCCLFVKTN